MFTVLIALLAIVAPPGGGQPPKDRVAPAPLGSRENPVLCHDPEGERAYLGRLRAPDGSDVRFEREGSARPGPCGHILDLYTTVLGGREVSVYLDLYHPGHWEDRAVPGFLITSRYSRQLFVGDDGVLRRMGEQKPAEGEVIDRGSEGRPLRQMTLEAGRIVGELRAFHDNGKVRESIEFQNGKQHGRYVAYDEKGNQEKVGQFVDGVSQGVWSEFDARGVKRREYEVVDGEFHGHERIYNGRGELIKENWYEKGEVVRSEVHKPAGR